jgi:gluconate 2-dehydrogenase alpha chain
VVHYLDGRLATGWGYGERLYLQGPFEQPRDNGHDEVRYAVDKELAQNTAVETWTLRHDLAERALPIRRIGSFAPASGVGGSGVSWAGQTWRFSPRDFEIRSRTATRYGEQAIPAEMSIQDWSVTYDEL